MQGAKMVAWEVKRVWQLRLDLTSDQAFFTRLGSGKAKHLSTRLLWTQQAMRRQWFEVFRISTKENPADLNTKALSREGLVLWVKFLEEMKKSLIKGRRDSLWNCWWTWSWRATCKDVEKNFGMDKFDKSIGETDGIGCQITRWHLKLAVFVILCMAIVMLRILYKLTEKMERIENYKKAIQQIQEIARFVPQGVREKFCIVKN